MNKATLVSAMNWEHPMRTFNVGTVNANVARALSKEFGPCGESELSPKIKTSLQQVVRLASRTKRACQRAIGQYIERLSIQGVEKEDRVLLDKLCPRVHNKLCLLDSNKNDCDDEAEADQEPDAHDASFFKKNEPLQFLNSLLVSIYNSKLPINKGMGSHVRCFIERAKDFLPRITEDGANMTYPGTSFLQSTAMQLSIELRKHYKNGSTDLCEKV
jgi:hypothetical protein